MSRPVGFYLPLILTVVGTLLYHLAQKTMPPAVSSFALLAATFATALVICLVSLSAMERAPLRFRQFLNWPSFLLGIAVVLIEVGFLTAYRVGWKLNRAALTSNVAVAVVLIPLGAMLFQEQVSWRMLAGAVLCISGLILLV